MISAAARFELSGIPISEREQEGMIIVFRVGLQLLMVNESELLQLPFEKLFHALRDVGADSSVDPDALLKNALQLRVSSQLRELSKEYTSNKTSVSDT